MVLTKAILEISFFLGFGQRHSISSYEVIAQSRFYAKVFVCK